MAETNITQKDKDVIAQMEVQSKTSIPLFLPVKVKPVRSGSSANELMSTDQKLIDDPVGIALPDQAQS